MKMKVTNTVLKPHPEKSKVFKGVDVNDPTFSIDAIADNSGIDRSIKVPQTYCGRAVTPEEFREGCGVDGPTLYATSAAEIIKKNDINLNVGSDAGLNCVEECETFTMSLPFTFELHCDYKPLEVEILASTPNAKAVVFAAIRRCYSALPGVGIFVNDFAKYEQRTTEDGNGDSERLMRSAMKSGHLSTFEHISFTFAIDNLSRAALAQLTRHRIGFSYSVQSQRYVKHITNSKNGAFNATIPNLDYLKDDEERMSAHNLLYTANFQAQDTYNHLIKMGVRAEDARAVIPQDMDTNLILTCNLRALLDFCGKREKGKGAQGEIADLAEQMLAKVIEREPWVGRIIK